MNIEVKFKVGDEFTLDNGEKATIESVRATYTETANLGHQSVEYYLSARKWFSQKKLEELRAKETNPLGIEVGDRIAWDWVSSTQDDYEVTSIETRSSGDVEIVWNNKPYGVPLKGLMKRNLRITRKHNDPNYLGVKVGDHIGCEGWKERSFTNDFLVTGVSARGVTLDWRNRNYTYRWGVLKDEGAFIIIPKVEEKTKEENPKDRYYLKAISSPSFFDTAIHIEVDDDGILRIVR